MHLSTVFAFPINLGLSATFKVLGCVTIWRHWSLLLKLCLAVVNLLPGDERMRGVGEQGCSNFQVSLALMDRPKPPKCVCAIEHSTTNIKFKLRIWRCKVVFEPSS